MNYRTKNSYDRFLERLDEILNGDYKTTVRAYKSI